MQSVDQIMAQYRVKRDYATENIQKLEEEWNLYNETGFELKARDLKPKLLFAKAARQLGNPIIIKRPEFHVERPHAYPFPKLWLEDVTDGYYRDDALYLYEVEPTFFIGDIPTWILKATLQAKTLGFKPYAWLVSKKSEIGKYVRSPAFSSAGTIGRILMGDPAIVAYPIVGKESGEDVINNEFGIVLGLWGKDLEQIDKALRERR